MDFKSIYDELKALQNMAFNLSKDDKKRVRQLSKDLKIDFVERKNCNSCFSDQLIILLIFVKKQLLPEQVANCDYIMINNKDVWIKGKRINSETLTNELAEWLIENYKKYNLYIAKK